MKATHKVRFCGIRCYLNEATGRLRAVDPKREWLMAPLLYLAGAVHIIARMLRRERGPDWFCFATLEDFYGEKEA